MEFEDFALANEDIGKLMEDLIENFRNCFKNFVKDIGLIFWSIWVFQVKIGKKFTNRFLEMDGKYCMKSKVQSSKLIAILGFIPVWRSLNFYDGLIDLANDSLVLDVPRMFCKIDIIETLDYLFEYEAFLWDLVWWRFNGYLKIEDFEDFTRWKIFDMELIGYFFGSYVWFHTLLWSWTWKWIGWDPDEVIVMPLDANSQVMHCQVIFIKENKRLFCSFVYGCNYYIDRRNLWSSLEKHYNLVAGQPWLIAGDFNVTRELVDSMAGHSKISRGMVEFNECINSIEVQDINSNGLHYTWNQRPRGAFGALKKLDRVLGNHKLIEDFPNVFANFQPYRVSDHSPMIIKFPIKRKFMVRPFKFVNSLVLMDNFLPIVESVWKTDVEGFGMFRLCQKLKLLKKPLRKLLTSHGNFAEKVSKCREELCRVQECLDLDPCNEELRLEEGIYLQSFLNASREEESYLKQRAKVHWLKEGDSNSAYFHKVVKGKINRNRIETILDGNGNWKEGDEAFKVIVDYFGEFLGVEHGVVPIIRPEDLDFRKLDNQQALDMIKEVTDEEIKAALFDIDDDKAPGPDGFSSKFFKKAWMIVGSDFCFAVKEFFLSKKILKEVNATVIALVPKVQTPGKVGDYRPISCCNVIYKCISKVIVNRIRDHLGCLVSDNQSAFIPGRSILDNILLSQELVRGYHINRGFARCAMKVDIQKAYDTVNWSFLRNILKEFGFHESMITWIMNCVTTSSFMININGSFHGFFQGKRGLRQGCPLSPYLFTLVMEVFNLMLKRRIKECSEFKYHWRCKEQELTHLCFADDLMVFCHGNSESIKVIKKAMDEFANSAGLIPNLSKSHIFFGNVKVQFKRKILRILPFIEGKLPMKYLGIPLISTKLFIRDCKGLVDKVKKRVNDWKNKSLSYAGRLQLISAVLASLPVYWASVVLLPKGINKEIGKIMREFLWKSGQNRKGAAKVSWNEICKPKSYGGLGLKNLNDWNIALLSSRIWKLISGQNSLWVKWVNCYLLEGRSFWDVGPKDKMSWSWRNLLKIRPSLRDFFYSRIGNGKGTSMWYDNWHQLGPLSYVLSPREITNAGYNIRDKVSDVIVDENWNWPSEWTEIIPQLGDFPVPRIIREKKDEVYWVNYKGKIVPFTVNQVSSSLMCRESIVEWYDLVWFQNRIPSHCFILWLAILGRLRTQDRMKRWKDSNDFSCVFCNSQIDSHSHLFFNCNYTKEIWKLVKIKAKMNHKSGNWVDIINELQCSLKKKSINNFIRKIALAASIYHIWNERNKRLFGKQSNSVENVVKIISEDIRLKIFSLKMGYLGLNEELCKEWNVPVKNIDYFHENRN
uniref:Reverse transcriptase domain-containing protein n=1 Tax=Lactuca sativa TaxID=4236 RepID=A0A9R1WSP9_LACSA|nr:hypothetical protein LSAT_V11C900454780 [Lactuca sativa]